MKLNYFTIANPITRKKRYFMHLLTKRTAVCTTEQLFLFHFNFDEVPIVNVVWYHELNRFIKRDWVICPI